MSSNEKGNENGNEKRNENESEKEDENETMNQSNINIIKELNGFLVKIIDKSKPFEEQTKSIKIVKDLNEYYYISDYGNKELEFEIFKTCKICQISLTKSYLNKYLDIQLKN